MTTPTKHRGKISITRFSGDDEGISIELVDETSRVSCIRVEMSIEAFGIAVTGRSFQPCAFELRRVDLVGLYAEYKTVVVPIEGYSFDTKAKKAAVAPFEVDGWRADLDDLGNHHRRVEKGYTVGFRRHVKTPAPAPTT